MTSSLGGPAERPAWLDEDRIEAAESAAAAAAEGASQAAIARSVAPPVLPAKRWRRSYARLLVGADTLAALTATTAAYLVRPSVKVTLHARSGFLGEHITYLQLAGLSLVVWLAFLAGSGAYRSKHFGRDGSDYRLPVVAALKLVSAGALISYAFRADLSRLLVATYFAALIVGAVVWRAIAHLVLRHARRRGRAHVRLLLVGERRAVRDFADHLLAKPDHDFDVVGVCASGTGAGLTVRGRTLPVLTVPDEAVDAAHAVNADAVLVVNPTGLVRMSLQQLSWQLEQSGADMLVAPDTVALAGPRLKVSTIRGLPVTHVVHPRHESLMRAIHFGLSRILGAALALLATPLLLAIALAVKLTSPGPVLYRQRRVGYKAREFDMYKFRSMVDKAEDLLPSLLALNEHQGALFKIRDDPRVTRVGRFLRKYSLDELPQLLNVIKGEMALVGPRPCLARELVMFGEAEHRRFIVRPGMTGLWQVSGGPELDWSDAVKTDLYYVDNWSPGLDLTILARTIKVVLGGNSY